MARIAGVDIPQEKRVEVGLTYVKGIGRNRAKEILEKIDVSPDMRVKDLTDVQVGKIIEAIDKGGYRVEGELSSEVALNIKRLREIRSFRGLRHEKGLPVRGQRTRTNVRTRRGRRLTVGGTSKAARLAKKQQKT